MNIILLQKVSEVQSYQGAEGNNNMKILLCCVDQNLTGSSEYMNSLPAQLVLYAVVTSHHANNSQLLPVNKTCFKLLIYE